MLRHALRIVPFVVLVVSVAHAASTNISKHRNASQSSDWAFLNGAAPNMPLFNLLSSPDNWLGGSGNWSNSSLWSSGLPGQNSNATINTGNDYVTLDTSTSINSLTIGGSSGSSTLIDANGNGYAVSIAGALTINQSGNLTLGNSSSQSADSISAGANSINAGNISLGGLSSIAVTGNFTNSGTIQLNGSPDNGFPASISVSGNFTNQGTIEDTPNGYFGDPIYVNGSLTNSGSIGSDTGGIGPILNVAQTLTNSGDIQAGLNVGGTLTNTTSGQITLYSGGSVGSLNNSGGITLWYGGFDVAANASNSGQITIFVNDDPGSGISVGGTMTNLSSGVIVAAGFQNLPATISAMDLSNSGSIQLQGYSAVYVSENVTNSGNITSMTPGDNEMTIGGTFANNVGAVFQLLGTGDTATITNLVNLGQISVGDGATLTVPVSANAAGNALAGFLNAGNVLIQQGGEISSFGKYTQTTGQTTVDGHLAGIINFAGGSIYGNGGTISGSITSNASINVGDEPLTVGQLTFAGNYTQGSHGSLTFDIAGLNQYDQMTITGQAHLNGLMTVDLLHGYIPQIGNLFEIMTFANGSGTFSNVVGLPIDNQEHFVLQYNSTNLTLNVVAGQLSGITSVKLGSGNSISYDPFIPTADSGSGYQLAMNEAPSQTTPEPSAIFMFGTGVAGIAALLSRRRNS